MFTFYILHGFIWFLKRGNIKEFLDEIQKKKMQPKGDSMRLSSEHFTMNAAAAWWSKACIWDEEPQISQILLSGSSNQYFRDRPLRNTSGWEN